MESCHDCTIWIEIILQRQKNVLICAGYRQWDTPIERRNRGVQLVKYNLIKFQLKRYTSIVNNWYNASKEGKNIIIMMDDNLDDSHDSTTNDQNQPSCAKSSKIGVIV